MRRAAASALVLALAGCESIEKAKAAHGPAATKTLAAVAAVALDVKTRPNTAVPTSAPPAPAVLAVSDRTSPSGNAYLVYEEDLAKRGELGSVYARVDGTGQLAECAAFLDHGTQPWDPKKPTRWTAPVAGFEVSSRLEHCGQVKYLFVIRTTALAKSSNVRVVPRPDGGVDPRFDGGPPDVPGFEACSSPARKCLFAPTYMKALVHFYTLDPVAHRGAFVLDAESSEQLAYYGGTELDAQLERDLANNVKVALGKAFKEHASFVKIEGVP